MYEGSNKPASDLRARGEQVRAGNATTIAPNRVAPVEQGERLATAPRGDREELRFTWAEYKGRSFLSIRLWSRDTSGQWWPTKGKGIAIRRHEMAALAEATAAALDLADVFGRDTHNGGAR